MNVLQVEDLKKNRIYGHFRKKIKYYGDCKTKVEYTRHGLSSPSDPEKLDSPHLGEECPLNRDISPPVSQIKICALHGIFNYYILD